MFNLCLLRMVGQVLGAVGHLPSIYTELEVSYYLLRRLLGVRTEGKANVIVRVSPVDRISRWPDFRLIVDHV